MLEYTGPVEDDDPEVQTATYSYNVSHLGKGCILRYDNQHSEWRYPGHRDAHHKHILDWQTGDELPDSPIWVGADGWPTLGDVLHELEQWHADHYQKLPEPEAFVSNLESVTRQQFFGPR